MSYLQLWAESLDKSDWRNKKQRVFLRMEDLWLENSLFFERQLSMSVLEARAKKRPSKISTFAKSRKLTSLHASAIEPTTFETHSSPSNNVTT